MSIGSPLQNCASIIVFLGYLSLPGGIAMPQISIIVELHLKPGQQEAFEEIIGAHARASKEQEPGCLRFEVLRPIEKDGTPINDCVWLTELYKDQEAVAAHEASPRMPILSEKIGPMVVSRRLIYAAVVGD